MTSVAWDLLTAHLMSGSGNPVLRELAQVSIDVFVHLGASGKVHDTHHALLESDAAHVLLNTSGLTDLFVDSTGSFAEKVIFERHMARIAREVFTRPEACLLGHVLCRLAPLMRHVSVRALSVQRDKTFNSSPSGYSLISNRYNVTI